MLITVAQDVLGLPEKHEQPEAKHKLQALAARKIPCIEISFTSSAAP